MEGLIQKELKIFSGEYKNKRLRSSPGKMVRPISGLVKEALFSILQKEITGSLFLDLFAGTGSVGLEALSRGAEFAVFIEKDPDAVQLIRENVNLLGVEDKTEVIHTDVFGYRAGKVFDVAYAAPPYKSNLGTRILEHCKRENILGKNSLLVLQRHHKEKVNSYGYKKTDSRKYGISTLDFFRLDLLK